ncbi:maleylacetate reductase [Achromobacter sp. UMC46]|uniref:maleylacetate reductase n=1 Tax=Achromobacter sp. UMC46 TaxID=1862319 RepID=UPI0015FF5812|nr:maleylacetate reductase [Achromobacter sp. UMC46]MBB1595759.1 maleylacetate reductase [Achromobacter sp. UMC46]
MLDFVYQALPARVIFQAGALSRLPEEVQRLGVRRVLVLTTPGQRKLGEQAARALGALAVGVCSEAVMHVPREAAQAARAQAEQLSADGCVAIGGGSTIGLGKAIALTSSLPILAVPTTYAGSEMTPIHGMTENGLKTTGRDLRVLPKTVIYDPLLTLDLPPALSAASGMNAMAHAVEALYAQDANPIVSLMAQEAIRSLARALPAVVAKPRDESARAGALYGAWLAGTCLGAVGMALHHKICHTLGGSFNLPHAQTHAIMLPYTAHYNHTAAPEALQRVARALGGDTAAEAGPLLMALNRSLGLPASLAQIGMPENGILQAAETASRNPYYNPRPVLHDDILAMLQRAWRGDSAA